MTSFSDLGGWPGVLSELLDRHDLPGDRARAAMSEILAGNATPAQIAAFVVALRAKAVLAHRNAGAGVPVCKHGNRASSSKCGSADVLAALGVSIEAEPAVVARCVERAGIGFCLATKYHPAFRHAGPPRREIGVPTVFNLLGPMANPARVSRQVIGVANPTVAERMIATLQAHGSTKAWVVHGNGLDELTTTGESEVIALENGAVRRFRVDPAALGLARATADQLTGGEPAENAAAARRILAGDRGPHRDIIVLNAAAALVVADAAADLAEGIARAGESIDSGAAAASLEALVRESNAH